MVFFFFLLLVKECRIGTEFQSTDSWGHNEALGYSHFLPLFEINRVALADAGPGLQDLVEGNASPLYGVRSAV